MPQTLVNFRVALIGPSDVADTHKALQQAVRELAQELLPRHVTIETIHWTGLSPGLGEPQKYIDKAIGWESMDFVIAVFDSQLGSSLPDGDSGTAHECREVMKAFVNRRAPDLLIFFSEHGIASDVAGQAAMESFKQDISTKAFYGTYENVASLVAKAKSSLRSKIEEKLSIHRETHRRIGELPPDRSISVELIVLSELAENSVTPCIFLLKNARNEYFIFDTRYMHAQYVADWIAHSMGFTKTTGKPLRQVLEEVNKTNIQSNTGIIQLWLGDMLIMDHPSVPVNDIKIRIVQANIKDGKFGFSFKEGKNTFSRPGPIMKKDANGKWSITL